MSSHRAKDPLRTDAPAVAAARRITRRRLAAVLCLVVTVWVGWAVYRASAAGRAADERLAALQTTNGALRADIGSTQREIDAAGSASWLTEQARRQGFVRDGEHVYVPVQPGAGGRLPANGGLPLPTLAPPPGVVGTPTPTASGSPRPNIAPVPAPVSTPSPAPTPILIVPPPRG